MSKIRKAELPLFLIFWVIGLLIGALLAVCNTQLSRNIAQIALSKMPTFFGILIANLLPVALLLAALSQRAVAFAYPIIFTESLSRGFCGMCIICFLGRAAWILRLLFLFSPCCISVLIWYLLYSYTQNRGHRSLCDFYIYLSFVLIFTIIDYFVISPFLVGLSKYF